MAELDFHPASARPDLVAAPVAEALSTLAPELAQSIRVSPIDASLADTAAFCDAYRVAPEASANCIVIAGRRGEVTTYAACVVLATTRADVNGRVRKLFDARRASFAAMDEATTLTGMEFGGITPLGLPADWRIFVDSAVVPVADAIVGAGIRAAKLFLPGTTIAALPGVEVIDALAAPIPPA